MIFSGDETCDVGADTASPVSDDYSPRDSHFTGKVEWVQIDIAEAAEDARPPDLTRGAAPDRDGTAVARLGLVLIWACTRTR